MSQMFGAGAGQSSAAPPIEPPPPIPPVTQQGMRNQNLNSSHAFHIFYTFLIYIWDLQDLGNMYYSLISPAPIIQSQPPERPVQPPVPAMQTRPMASGNMMGQIQPSAPAPVVIIVASITVHHIHKF